MFIYMSAMVQITHLLQIQEVRSDIANNVLNFRIYSVIFDTRAYRVL